MAVLRSAAMTWGCGHSVLATDLRRTSHHGPYVDGFRCTFDLAPARGACHGGGGNRGSRRGLRATDADVLASLQLHNSVVACSLFLGEAQVLTGHLEETRTLTEHTLTLARERQERGYQTYALRLLDEIASYSAPPNADQAVVHYRQALTLAEELGMRPLAAHCHLGLGTLYS